MLISGLVHVVQSLPSLKLEGGCTKLRIFVLGYIYFLVI